MPIRAVQCAYDKSTRPIVERTWASGTQFRPSIKTRPRQRTSAELNAVLTVFSSPAGLSDEFASMTICNPPVTESRSAPLPEIRLPEWQRRSSAFGLEFGQINPRQCRIQMVIQMPVVIQPDQIKNPPGADIPCALLHVPDGPIMVDVLKR